MAIAPAQQVERYLASRAGVTGERGDDPVAYDEPVSERISREQVAHVAQLARLTLTDGELELFTDQLGAVLDHAADLEALDVGDVPPTSHPFPLVNVLRDDVEVAGVDRDEVLAEAPSVEDGRFRVPPVLGEEP